MRIGYACITIGLPYDRAQSCTRKTATPERLRAVIEHNLGVLERQVAYNRRHGIALFRISSDLIPFGGSPVNPLPWQSEWAERFARIGGEMRRANMRVSMHPGQYTVLTARTTDIVGRAVDDLVYHAQVLDALGTDPSGKIVLHVGGTYGDKAEALRRFAARYADLPDPVRARLVIENDERCYHIADVLELAARLSLPAVYDALHNAVYPADPIRSDAHWIRQAAATWTPADGPQKVHYAQQEPGKRPGAHAQRIRLAEFRDFVGGLDGPTPDVMLEGKDKDLSAIKCALALAPQRRMAALEAEWARYKYLTLERDPNAYRAARALLKDKSAYPVDEFYRLIDGAVATLPTDGTFENAAQHVWGYFKDCADGAERLRFERMMARMRAGTLSHAAVKRALWALAVRYEQRYLLDSLFFADV